MADRASSMQAGLENSLNFDIPIQTPSSYDFMECWVQLQTPSSYDFMECWVQLNDYYVFALSNLSVNITLTSIGPQGIRESE